mmetsp:Transcript_121585/g.238876  ORF Transcript_121585/g.238876 Transcript_121585/m.238876 type:complete len:204 (+) Transcript_121585:35-646(+)
MILDRLLLPVTRPWFLEYYRGKKHGGMVYNVDVFCADPNDVDLPAVIVGYVTHVHATRAAEIALKAVEEWKAARPAWRPSVHDYIDMDAVRAVKGNDLAASLFFLGDLLLNGFREAQPTLREKREGIQVLRRASKTGSSWASDMARIELATCHHFGGCTLPRNLKAALYWYRKVKGMEYARVLAHMALLSFGNSTAEGLGPAE